jgi:hypothetical protein
MASRSPAEAVNIVADVLAPIVEADPGRLTEPGAELAASPAVGIEPGFPWAEGRHLGRPLTVHWRLRLIVGRWETGASLDVALATYDDSRRALRLAGYGVGDLESPQVVKLGGTPYLLAAFPITYEQ